MRKVCKVSLQVKEDRAAPPEEGQKIIEWELPGGKLENIQKSYFIRISDEKETVWESGMVKSGCTRNVYKGRKLNPWGKYLCEIVIWTSECCAMYGETEF